MPQKPCGGHARMTLQLLSYVANPRTNTPTDCLAESFLWPTGTVEHGVDLVACHMTDKKPCLEQLEFCVDYYTEPSAPGPPHLQHRGEGGGKGKRLPATAQAPTKGADKHTL